MIDYSRGSVEAEEGSCWLVGAGERVNLSERRKKYIFQGECYEFPVGTKVFTASRILDSNILFTRPGKMKGIFYTCSQLLHFFPSLFLLCISMTPFIKIIKSSGFCCWPTCFSKSFSELMCRLFHWKKGLQNKLWTLHLARLACFHNMHGNTAADSSCQ